VAAKFPTLADAFVDGAQYAFYACASQGSDDNAYAADEAVYIAFSPDAVHPEIHASRAAKAVVMSAQAAFAASAAFAYTWASTSSDADFLSHGGLAAELSDRRLWPRKAPVWMAELWAKLKSALRPLNEDWDVWTRWYDERLAGAASHG